MPQLKIETSDILSALGYTSTAIGAPVLEAARDAARRLDGRLTPGFACALEEITQIHGADVTLKTGDTLSHAPLADALDGCTHALLAVMTVGGEIDRLISDSFKEGDALAAMMFDAAGTAAVLRYAEETKASLTDLVRRTLGPAFGLTAGLSPGENGWALDQQAVIFKLADTRKIGVSLTASFMMRPSKTVSFIFGAGPGACGRLHVCGNCTYKNCPIRDDTTLRVTVRTGGRVLSLTARRGTPLADVLARRDVALSPGGQARENAAARFSVLVPEATEADRARFTAGELADGWRLIGDMRIAHPLEIDLPD